MTLWTKGPSGGAFVPIKFTTATAFGARTIGSSAYTVPSTNVVFVSPTGSSANSGTTVGAPKQTLNQAIGVVPSGSTGWTLVLRAGTYREALNTTRSVTIQPYPNEAVYIYGSDIVTGWVVDGTRWRKDGWNPPLTRSDVGAAGGAANTNLAAWPDQVFFNGVPQTQVASLAACAPGTFFVDTVADQLYVGSNPTAVTVEASARTDALNLQGAGSTVRGIGIWYCGNHVNNQGALKLNANNCIAEECEFAYNATVGCSARHATQATGQIIRRCTAHHNGQMGLHGFNSWSLIVEQCWAYRNNTWSGGTGHFFTGPAHGGMKASFCRDGIWRDSLFEDNVAHGLWLDQYCHNATITGNSAQDNADAGIFYEYSDTAVIANNLTGGNDVGIQSLGQNVDIWNNTSLADLTGIHWYRGTRIASDTDGIFDPVTQATVRVFNNLIVRAASSNTTSAGYIWFKNFRANTADVPLGITTGYNGYYRGNVTPPTLGLPVSSNSDNVTYYDTLAAAPAGHQTGSVEVTGFTADPSTINSPGTTLPANVAAAIGVSGAPKKGYLG